MDAPYIARQQILDLMSRYPTSGLSRFFGIMCPQKYKNSELLSLSEIGRKTPDLELNSDLSAV